MTSIVLNGDNEIRQLFESALPVSEDHVAYSRSAEDHSTKDVHGKHHYRYY